MQEENLISPQQIYSAFLTSINGIRLSKREIDIISCILNGRTAKGTANLLSISPKTAEAHTYNMMKKLGCLSRESLISLMEGSDKLLILKKYYLALLTALAFEQTLRDIAKLKEKEAESCLIVHWEKEEKKSTVLANLKSHLELASIKTSFDKREDRFSFEYLTSEPRSEGWTIYMLPKGIEMKSVSSSSKRGISFGKKVLFISVDKDSSVSFALEGGKKITLSENQNYYFFIFDILKQIFPENDLASLIEEFRKKYGCITHPSEANSSCPLPKKLLSSSLIQNALKQRKWQLAALFSVCVIFIALACWVVRFYFKEPNISPFQLQLPEQPITTIAQSNLNLPKETTFLNRSELIAKIDEKLKSQAGIQTIALVGMGGVGKTTLARHYAHQQNASVIWEINAETQESLQESFNQLAQALAKTEEDQKLLREIQEIKDLTKRENRVLEFAKEHLKAHPHWFLLYDNVEKFAYIQKHFPQDMATWGKGKVILTTRNSNIQNNEHVNSTLPIGELLPQQKLRLFTQIMGDNASSFTPKKIEEAKKFLESIPSFPLDVSVAAYYLKSSAVSYAHYLENLQAYNKEFEHIQADLLKEAGDYTKTRYGIIISSLYDLLAAHRDFKDLLLFMCLLDSQDIPRDLLNRYKNQIIVDNFIYHLQKYSLITKESHISSFPIFSIHRSTQAIALAYLTIVTAPGKNPHLLHEMTKVLEKKIEKLLGTKDITTLRSLISHYEAFSRHEKLLPNEIRSKIYSMLGNIHFHLGNYVKAEKAFQKNLANLNQSLIENDVPIANASAALGNTYRELGDYEKSLNLLEQSLTIYKEHLPKTYLEMAQVLSYLGYTYRTMGNYEKSREFLEESLNTYEKHLPKNSVEIARVLGYLGHTYRSLGKYKKAKEFLQRSLMLYRQHAPENQFDIAWSLSHLGVVEKELGNYGKAQELINKALSIYKNFFPNKHIIVARTLGYLGNLYKDLGDYERARELIDYELRILKGYYPKDNIKIARCLEYLGQVCISLGIYEKAKDLIEQSLSIFKRHYPEDHIRVARSLATLGTIERELRNYEGAKNLLQNSLRIYERTYGGDHINIARILKSLGKVYILEGQYYLAENSLKKSLHILQQNEHPEQYVCLESLAELYTRWALQEEKEGNFYGSKILKEKAIQYFTQALDKAKIYFPTDSPHIKRIQSKLRSLEQRLS